MSYPLSRLMSTATAGYGAFALLKPDHLGSAMQAGRSERGGYDVLARTYGVRDLGISAAGALGRSDKVVRTAMLLRIVGDLGDCAILAAKAPDSQVRSKVMAVTLGWAALNTVALVVDGRRAA
ncbi:hypothetical protein [Nocardioides kribbensis]|uniref:hypothetical protein n=1 Tax=Nocardioides kribbensis TaxID=305517 RepID=UPI00187AE4EE|nr:hypothetical protein [Nocardioides kribbensis]